MKNEAGVSNEKIMGFLVEMDGRITGMSRQMATKHGLEQMKIDIIEPIIRAVDKDAEIVYDHGKRIAVLERKVGIAK